MAVARNVLAAPAAIITRPYTTGTLSPSANALVMLIVSNTGSVSDTSSKLASNVTSTFAINGSWAIMQVADPGATSRASIHVWWAITTGSPGSGTITLNTGASPADSHIGVIEFTGIDTSTPMTGYIGPAATATAAFTLTLTAAPAAADWTYTIAASRNDTNGATVGSGFTLDFNAFHASPTASLSTQSRTGSTSTSAAFAGLGTVSNAAMAFNVKVAPAGGTVHQVTGTVAVTSTTTGTVTARLAASGTVAVVSTTTGDATLVGGATVHQVSGTVAATSTTSGAPTARLGAAGTVAAVSTTAGAPTSRQGVAGAVAVTSTTAGSPTSKQGASGTVAATSTTSGAVTVIRATAGTATVTSSTAGSPTSKQQVAGTVDVISTTAGSPSLVGGPVVHPVAGTVTVTSSTSGAVSLRAAAAGELTILSATQGAATLLAVAAGTVTVVSTTAGDVTLIEGSGPVDPDGPPAVVLAASLSANTASATIRAAATDARVRLGTTEATIHTPTISGGLR